MIIRYDSTASLRADYIRLHPGSELAPVVKIEHEWHSRRGRLHRHTSYATRGESDSWYGNESESESIRLAALGQTSLVPSAEKLLDELDTHIDTPRRVWNRSPAGAFVVVPEFLSGVPTYMRRQSYELDEQAPITVLAVTTSSAGISAETLAKRGTVILALVMALSRVRPVSLQQLTILDGSHDGETVITSTINTSPLDLAGACYVLTSAGFARRLTYGIARKKNRFSGGWPARFHYGNPTPYYNALKAKLVDDPSKCLIIGAAQLGDELLSQPVRWIENQIKRFTHMQEEEATL